MRKAMALLACLALLVTGAAAQESQRRGRVVNESGEPVAGARVTLYRLGRFDNGVWDVRRVDRTVSGGDGTFSLAGDALGHDIGWMDFIVVVKEGLAVGWVHRHWGDAADAVIALGEPVGLSGRVIDVEGKPIAGATVRTIAEVDADGERRVAVFLGAADELTATSDDEGRFRMPGAPSGSSFDFIVSAPGHATIATMARYFDLGQLAVKAQHSAPRVWKEEGQEVILVMPPEARLEGTVVAKGTLKPLAGVRLSLERMRTENYERAYDPWDRRATVTGDGGRFSIGGMPPGEYRLITVPRPSDETAFMAPDVKLTLYEGSGRELEVQAERAVRCEFEVRDAETGAGVGPVLIRQGLPRETMGKHRVLAWADEDGRAVAFGVPGPYTEFRTKADGYSRVRYVKEMKLSGGRTYSVAMDAKRVPDITGVVLDLEGRPAAGVWVSLLPDYLPTARSPEQITGEDGRFTMSTKHRPIFEGSKRRRVVARDEEHNLAAVARIEAFDKPVELRLSAGTVVTGRVVDEDGKGLPGIEVSVNADLDELSTMNVHVYTDKEGRYEVRALPDPFKCGAFAYSGYHITALGRSCTPQPGLHRAEIEPIVLPQREEWVTGRVVDADGKAMPGVLVHLSESRTISDAEGWFRVKWCGFTQTLSCHACSRDLVGHVVSLKQAAEDLTLIMGPRSRPDRREREPESLVGRKLPDIAPFGLEIPEGRRLVVMFFDMNSRVSRHWVGRLDDMAEDLAEKGAAVLLVDISGEGLDAAKKWGADARVSLPIGAATGDIDEVRYAWGFAGAPWIIVARPDGRVTAECVALQDIDARLAEIEGR